MEYIDGVPIGSAKDQQPLPPAVALRLATQMAAALEAAHVKNIIHRDLKPANILVTKDGVVKLLDFGLAKQSVEGAAAGDDNSVEAANQITCQHLAILRSRILRSPL